ncbi:MAG TPA: DNA helicase PcrA [Actinomycetes bacterium]|jgi:DNA helicase-2/ATP-dependent DNA helicase PcrA|nr:DNA helicase PcrA [Actinomycetes bacterium]
MDAAALPEPQASPELLEGLNDAQRRAVLATEGPTLIVAGAGSGKTRVLTYRIAHLIRDRGVHPGSVLAITFTNKAAREMHERLHGLVGGVVKAMWVSTFHSACVRILRRSGSRLGYKSTFTIYDESDAERLMTAVCRELDYDPKRLSARSMRHAVSSAKDELLTPGRYADRATTWFEKKAAQAYELYQRRLEEANAVDFDDLIMQTVRLLSEHEEVLAEYQERFRYVLVDEFQDTNVAQYELLKLLTARHRNLSVVGDGDQSIYAFRGATVRNILDFEADYPDATVILLEQNYRSTQTILSAANSVIANNLERKPKNLWTVLGQGHPIVRYQADNEHDEAAFVAEEVERLRQRDYRYGQMVVFYRTNAQSRVLEEVFVKAGLPYKVVGGVKFYDRREVKDLLAYVKAVVNPQDTVSLRRVLNVPRRGIGETSERVIERFANEEGIPFGAALRRAGEIPGLGTRQARGVAEFIAVLDELREGMEEGRSPSVLVEDAWNLSGLMRELEADRSIEGQGRVENVRELQSVAEEYELRDPEGGLAGFLESIALVSDADEVETASQGITLMTVHTAKGLEYPVVFIVGLEENVFPHVRAIGEPRDLEEERRLAYVGITRARERLYLTNAWSRTLFGSTSYNQPSRFLNEVPEELVTVVSPESSARRFRRAATDWSDASPAFGAGRGSLGPRTAAAHGRPPAGSFKTSTPAARLADQQRGALDLDLAPGDAVVHRQWGAGVVRALSGQGERAMAEVEFPGLGRKRLLLRYAPLTKP